MLLTSINGRWSLNLPPYRHKQWEQDWQPYGWEPVRLASMHANLKPGMLVYDIGAEEGDFPALWASWGCRVVLVEPVPNVWPNIKAVHEANNLPAPVACFAGFVGDHDGYTAEAIVRGGWPRQAGGTLVANHGFACIHERPEWPRIQIDTLAEKLEPPDAITMDIEGAELIALRGAERTLREHRPLIWVSVHPTFMADTYRMRVTDLWGFLESCGYRWRLLDYDHELHTFAWPAEEPEPVLL